MGIGTLQESRKKNYRDVAQLGSVPPWGGGGRRFKSCRSEIIKRPSGLFLLQDLNKCAFAHLQLTSQNPAFRYFLNNI